MKKRHSRGFIDAAALRFNNTVFNLIAHAQTVTAANAVGFEHEFNLVIKHFAVERDRDALFKANGHFFGFDVAVFTPERNTHDRVNNLDAAVQMFKILGFVCRAEHVGVGRISFFLAHLVAEAVVGKELAHFCSAAELADELNVKPGLVDLELRIGDQTVAVEALNVVSFVGGAVTPDVDAVFSHRVHEHCAGNSASERCGVVVSHAAGGNVKRVALNRSNAFGNELLSAVHETCDRSAEFHGSARNCLIIILVGLTEVGCVGARESALLFHPK